MYDRNVEHPNRYQLVKVEGTDDIFDLVPAPGTVNNEGTLINKNSLLKDATAALFGLRSTALPDDVLKKLSELYWHVWYRNPVVYIPGSYTTGEVETFAVLEVAAPNLAPEWTYASSFTFEESTGEFALVNPSTVSFDFYHAAQANVLKGKYGIPPNSTDKKKIYYFPANQQDAVTTVESVWHRVLMQAQEMKGVAGKYPTTQSEAVLSPDRSAYPDSGEQDGYAYSYIGTPFENAEKGVKIETGSYVGTDAYGASNPNSLTFGFPPKVFVLRRTSVAGFPAIFFRGETATHYYFTYNTMQTLTVDWSLDGKTVSWYNTEGHSQQMNSAAYRYSYFAIG